MLASRQLQKRDAIAVSVFEDTNAVLHSQHKKRPRSAGQCACPQGSQPTPVQEAGLRRLIAEVAGVSNLNNVAARLQAQRAVMQQRLAAAVRTTTDVQVVGCQHGAGSHGSTERRSGSSSDYHDPPAQQAAAAVQAAAAALPAAAAAPVPSDLQVAHACAHGPAAEVLAVAPNPPPAPAASDDGGTGVCVLTRWSAQCHTYCHIYVLHGMFATRMSACDVCKASC